MRRALAGEPGVPAEDADLVAAAMDWAEAGMDFADASHVAAARGCERFLTLDRRLVRAGGRRGGVAIAAP